MRQFEFVGGAPCLDFANTVGGLRGTPSAREYLRDFADLASWCHQAGIVTASEARDLAEASIRDPERAGAVFARAIALREAIYRLCTAVVEHATPIPADLDILNAELAAAGTHRRLVPAGGGLAWTWEHGHGAPDALLWPIAHSAAELLAGPEAGTLGQCASATCGWLFVDTTKNHRRRWCDMRGCGNRAKVRRHRARRPGEAE